jgi:hypothetical protein
MFNTFYGRALANTTLNHQWVWLCPL